MNPHCEARKPPDNPPPKRRGRPIRPLRPKSIPGIMEDRTGRDQVHRVPAGGGYRILRCPRMLDSEE